MIKQIQPYCVFFNNELDEESKNDLFNIFIIIYHIYFIKFIFI